MNGTFDFDTKTISTINTDFGSQSTFDSSVKGDKSCIPVIVESQSTVKTKYGNTVRDAVLKLQLDNEAGNYFILKNEEDEAILTMYSKTGVELSSVNIPHQLPSILGVTNKYLYVDYFGNIIWKEGTDSPGAAKILFDTVEGWNSQPDLRSQLGTIYVYTDKDYILNPDHTSITYVPGIKIGDGNAYLIDKPFITAAIEAKLIKHIDDVLKHIQPGEREKWNNKLNYIDPGNTDMLTFTRN